MSVLGIIKAGLAAGLLINLSLYGQNTMVLQVPREAMGFWVAYGFVLGFVIAWLYAYLLTCHWGAGLWTAVRAAILVWFVVGGLNVLVMAAISPVAWGWSLAHTIVAGVLVAKLYREPDR